MWDERDHEPYCFNCGWRSYTVINQEQAKARVKWSSWVKLLASKVNYSDGFNSRLILLRIIVITQPLPEELIRKRKTRTST